MKGHAGAAEGQRLPFGPIESGKTHAEGSPAGIALCFLHFETRCAICGLVVYSNDHLGKMKQECSQDSQGAYFPFSSLAPPVI